MIYAHPVAGNGYSLGCQNIDLVYPQNPYPNFGKTLIIKNVGQVSAYPTFITPLHANSILFVSHVVILPNL